MKKQIAMILTVVLLLGLAGCGGSGTKVALVESQFEALDDLFQRAGTAVAQVDAAVAASEGAVNASFGEYYSRLSSQRDSYADSVAGADKLDDEELDALLASLEGAVDEAKPIVTSLEEMVPEIEKLGANTKALLDDLTNIVPLATASGVNADLQREYTELATAYQGLEGQLNTTLAQAEGGGLAETLQALRQANETLVQLCEKASNLLAGLQA